MKVVEQMTVREQCKRCYKCYSGYCIEARTNKNKWRERNMKKHVPCAFFGDRELLKQRYNIVSDSRPNAV